MSSENSSYESAPLAPDPQDETLVNGPAAGEETLAQEAHSHPAPDPSSNADPVPNTDPNPNPEQDTDPPKRRGRKKKEVSVRKKEVSVKKKEVPLELPPNYQFKFQEEEKLVEPEGSEQAEIELFKYKVNDLVWGKVKHHPWWPGQIYDPLLASEAALKIKKDAHLLVGFFGDSTFAWNEASTLKPYMICFPTMENQSSAELFVRAVDSSLTEVSRRIEVALVCNCSDKKHVTEQFIDNAGIIDGTRVPEVDNSVILESFKIDRLMHYVQEAALCGFGNLNRLDAVMAAAYLKAFDKSRGFPAAPQFGYGEEFGNDPDKVSGMEQSGSGKKRGRPKKKDERKEGESKEENQSTSKKRGRPKKNKQVSVNTDSDHEPRSVSNKKPKRGSSSRKAKGVRMSSDEIYGRSSESDNMPKKRGRPKKRKQIDTSDDDYDSSSESDEEPKKRGRPKKLHVDTSDDEYDFLSSSDEMPKKRGRPKKKLGEISGKKIKSASKSRSPSSKKKTPISSDTGTPRNRGRPKKIKHVGMSDKETDSSTLSKPKTPTKSNTGSLKKRGRPRKESAQGPSVPVEYPPSTEMFVQLSLTAENPVESSKPTSTVLNFFTKYKNSLIPQSLEENYLIEETGTATKSGRRVSKPKHIQDSYWTDVMVDTGSDKDEELAATTNQRKKRGPYNKREKSNDKSSEENVVAPGENTLASTDVTTQILDESEPTGFVLYFNNPDAIPSVEELNETFGSYGPLRPAETEIDKKLNRATVIFKRRVNAEGAFSSIGKSSKLGPALLSYELDYTPGPPKVIPSNGDVATDADASTDARHLTDNGEASTKDAANIDVGPERQGGTTSKEEPAQGSIIADKPVEPSA